MTSNIQGGYGAVLYIDVSATLTVVTHVMDFEFPEFERVLAEVTAHDSDTGYAEYISTGKRKLNEFTVKLLWDDASATHDAILVAWAAEAPVSFRCEDPASIEMIEFEGLVTKVGRVAEQEEGYVCEVSIQPTGQPNFDSE